MHSSRYRRSLARLILAAWLFAMFFGISHACALHVAAPAQVAATDLCGMELDAMPAEDECPSANCLGGCADDTPVLTKLKIVHGEPAGSAVPATTAVAVVLHAAAPATAFAECTHPPPDVPLLLRSHRFAL